MNPQIEDEIDRNFFAFQARLASLMTSNADEFAVLRHQKLVGIHSRLSAALRSAHFQFPDGIFSVQKIANEPVDLGFFSHAANPR